MSASGIFLITELGQLVEMTEQPYDSEAVLQNLLASHPSIIAGDQLDPVVPRRWLLIAKEVSVPGEQDGSGRWSLDHVFLDQDAVPTIVEVKRSTDTRIRREVIGQMLEYAANAVVYWPSDMLRTRFDARCEAVGLDSKLVLEEFLGPEEDAEAFWERTKTNLQAGKVRLVFIADEIPPELLRIVEFLNKQMDPAEVIAIEIRQYVAKGNSSRTLIPRVLGQRPNTRGRPTRESRQWDERSFFADLTERKGPEVAAAAQAIREWASHAMTRVWWGRGAQDGSMVLIYEGDACSYYPATVWTYGRVEIGFQYLRTRPPFTDRALREELLRRLNQIPNVNLKADSIDKRPSISLSQLTSDTARQRFFEALEWATAEIEKPAQIQAPGTVT